MSLEQEFTDRLVGMTPIGLVSLRYPECYNKKIHWHVARSYRWKNSIQVRIKHAWRTGLVTFMQI